MIKLTPPMGWNSWNTFGENINEKMIFETADVMAESGLRDKGYKYLVIIKVGELNHFLHCPVDRCTHQSSETPHPMVDMHDIVAHLNLRQVL